jgi:DNA-binding MarR family transcriptional regulator
MNGRRQRHGSSKLRAAAKIVNVVNDIAISAAPVAVARRLRPVILHLARELRRELADLGLTGGQATLLASISAYPGIGVRRLAELEGVTAAGISGHVDRLEAAGLVTRVREAGDRRRVGLELTERGDQVLRAVRRRRTHWLATRLGALGPDELDAIDAAVEPLQTLLAERAA